jgi:two-component system chemotaxis sensor kinase CheA
MADQNKYEMLIDPDMKEIVTSFLEETKEIFENLNTDLVEMEQNSEDTELLNKIFRAFHTIKGTSGFLGLEKLQLVTHRCEDILNKLRKGEAKLDSALMDTILNSFDKIQEIVSCIEVNMNEDVETDGIIQELEEALSVLEGRPKPESAPESMPVVEAGASEVEDIPVEAEPAVKEVEAKESVEAAEPAEETEVKADTDAPKEEVKAAAEAEPVPEEENKVETEPKEKSAAPKVEAEKKTEIKDSKEETKDRGVSKALSNAKADTSIRVDVERLDELLNIVSELVLGRNQLQQVNNQAGTDFEGTQIARELSEATKQIDLMTNELQMVVMKTRMVKIGKVFNRFPRLVRDLSRETGKDIQLEIHGEDTELDKTLIEEINDPLVHIVRNSLDHGVETPEERLAKGKPAQGKVSMVAAHEGNNIIISVVDDGKGIDPVKIREKAISKGLITEEKAAELTLQETFNLIFAPGFSTAEKITNISGRGVGMDVVRTNVRKLRGIIDIDSEVDKGTTIKIKLPLTLAIISGMVVRVGKELMVIPLSSVIEAVRMHIEDIQTINGKEVIKVRDEIIPLVDINDVLYHNPSEKVDIVWQYVVTVGVAEQRFGIKVDALVGQKEIVIKSLGNYLGNVHGVAGSTIMGDGTVIMILDIGEILQVVKAEKENG